LEGVRPALDAAAVADAAEILDVDIKFLLLSVSIVRAATVCRLGDAGGEALPLRPPSEG
jgi:hypothetical protein